MQGVYDCGKCAVTNKAEGPKATLADLTQSSISRDCKRCAVISDGLQHFGVPPESLLRILSYPHSLNVQAKGESFDFFTPPGMYFIQFCSTQSEEHSIKLT